jgi:hypothetical protein
MIAGRLYSIDKAVNPDRIAHRKQKVFSVLLRGDICTETGGCVAEKIGS